MPLAQLAPQRRAEDRLELFGDALFGRRRTAGSDHRLQRIDDAEPRIGIDFEPELIGREHLLIVEIDIDHALVDPDELVDERPARNPPGAGIAELMATFPRTEGAR